MEGVPSVSLTLLVVMRFSGWPRVDKDGLSKLLGLVVVGNTVPSTAGEVRFMDVGSVAAISVDSDVASDSARFEN